MIDNHKNNYFEELALKILKKANIVSETAVLKDKPDIQDLSLDKGIEVTIKEISDNHARLLNGNINDYDKKRKDICYVEDYNCKTCDNLTNCQEIYNISSADSECEKYNEYRKKLDSDPISRDASGHIICILNKMMYCDKDHPMPIPFPINLNSNRGSELVKDAIEEKEQKSKNYMKFKDNDLFIFVSIAPKQIPTSKTFKNIYVYDISTNILYINSITNKMIIKIHKEDFDELD